MCPWFLSSNCVPWYASSDATALSVCISINHSRSCVHLLCIRIMLATLSCVVGNPHMCGYTRSKACRRSCKRLSRWESKHVQMKVLEEVLPIVPSWKRHTLKRSLNLSANKHYYYYWGRSYVAATLNYMSACDLTRMLELERCLLLRSASWQCYTSVFLMAIYLHSGLCSTMVLSVGTKYTSKTRR